MRYEDPAFRSKYCSEKYKEGWDRIFGESEGEETPHELQHIENLLPHTKEMDAPGLHIDVTQDVIAAQNMAVDMEIWLVVYNEPELEVHGGFVSEEAAQRCIDSFTTQGFATDHMSVIPTTLSFTK